MLRRNVNVVITVVLGAAIRSIFARPLLQQDDDLSGVYAKWLITNELKSTYSTYDSKELQFEIGDISLTSMKVKRQLPNRLSETHTEILRINSPTTSFVIHLQRERELISPNFKLMYGGVEQDLSSHDFRNCHFKGFVVNDEQDGQATFSNCDNGLLTGVIVTKSERYLIQPLPKTLRSRRQTESNKIIVLNLNEEEQSFCAVKCMPMTNLEEVSAKAKRDITPKPQTIETAIFADEKMFVWAGQQADTNSMLAITNLALSIMNGVQTVYDHPSLDIRFKFVVVSLEIIKDDQDAPNTANGNINEYLNNFCIWQNTKKMSLSGNGIDTWDHGILLTGMDLYSDNNKKSAVGMAWVSGMCRETLSCTINEGIHLNSINVISHEIGHNLGMAHDGDANSCSSDSYLMSPKTGPGRTTWSTCSNDYTYVYLTKPYAECLENAALTKSDLDFSKVAMPGQLYSADQQCQAAFGTSFHPHTTNEAPYENICRELWCANETHAAKSHSALVGTTCDTLKICKGGECVDSGILTVTSDIPQSATTENISADEETTESTSVDEETTEEISIDEETTESTSVDEETTDDTSTDEETTEDTPTDEETTEDTLTGEEATEDTSTDEETTQDESVDEETTQDTLADEETPSTTQLTAIIASVEIATVTPIPITPPIPTDILIPTTNSILTGTLASTTTTPSLIPPTNINPTLIPPATLMSTTTSIPSEEVETLTTIETGEDGSIVFPTDPAFGDYSIPPLLDLRNFTEQMSAVVTRSIFDIMVQNMNNRDNKRLEQGGMLSGSSDVRLVQEEENIVVELVQVQMTPYWQQNHTNCSKSCGNGTRFVSYICLTPDGEPSVRCSVSLKPGRHIESCNTEPCANATWYVSSSHGCSRGSEFETLEIVCTVSIPNKDTAFDIVSNDNCNNTAMPERIRKCDKLLNSSTKYPFRLRGTDDQLQ